MILSKVKQFKIFLFLIICHTHKYFSAILNSNMFSWYALNSKIFVPKLDFGNYYNDCIEYCKLIISHKKRNIIKEGLNLVITDQYKSLDVILSLKYSLFMNLFLKIIFSLTLALYINEELRFVFS